MVSWVVCCVLLFYQATTYDQYVIMCNTVAGNFVMGQRNAAREGWRVGYTWLLWHRLTCYLAFLCFCVIQKREGWGVPSSGESRKRAEMRTKKKVGVSVIVVRLTLGRAARACVMLEQPTRWCVWCARVYMWPLCRGILKYFESSFFFFFCQSDLSRHFPTLQAPTHSHTSVFGHHRRAR